MGTKLTLEAALRGTRAPEEIRAVQALVDVGFVDFTGLAQAGQIVVHRDLVDEVTAIFADLRALGFPLHSVVPVSEFRWSDDASMAANNCSGFNYRLAVGKAKLSEHALGRAVDVNPVQNPYVRGELILPPHGRYDLGRPGTILANGPVVAAFESRGWTWGGRWNSLKDWHHFEKPGA